MWHPFERTRQNFLDDGGVEIDSNVVERSIRPIALNRKKALFASSDGGAEHWAAVASLIEICKLNSVEPLGYLAEMSSPGSATAPQQPDRRSPPVGLHPGPRAVA